MSDDLDLLLRRAEVPGPRVGPAELDRLAACVVEDGLRDELVAAVLETCDAVWDDSAGQASDGFGLRLDGWRLDLDRAPVRRALLAAVLAGALVQQGRTQMLMGVVAALLPTVLDVEDGWPAVAERGVEPRVRLRADVATEGSTADAAHESLPPALRGVVNPLELVDLVQQLRELDPR